MITQAWNEHQRQQLAVSVSPKQLKEFMMAEWGTEMRGYMNEAFTMELCD
jgi:predicted lipid-binding transport protein (Tim44 family)